MNLKIKKAIDYYAGRPLLFMLAYISRLISWAGAKKRRSIPFKDGDAILIMKFQGLGSLLLAKPGLHQIRNRYPTSKIYFWGTASTACMAELMPEFDDIIVLHDKGFFVGLGGCIKNLLKIWRIRPKWTFDLEVYSRLSSSLAMLSLAPYRAGFAIDVVGNRKYTHTHLLLFNRYEWIGWAYARLLSLSSAQGFSGNEISFGSWKMQFSLPNVFGLESQSYAVINCHSGELSSEREWPLSLFKKFIAELLVKYPNQKIVLIGKGSKEEKTCDILVRELDSRVISLAGKLSLAETLSTLHFAQFVVSNDSGPLHMSVAVGAPTLGLFGPTRPNSYIQSSNKVRYVYKELYCSPCVHHWAVPPCGGNNHCMKRISIDDVMEALELLIEDSSKVDVSGIVGCHESPEGYVEGLVLSR